MLDLYEGVLREFADMHGVPRSARFDDYGGFSILKPGESRPGSHDTQKSSNAPEYNARKRAWWARNKERLNAARRVA